MSVTVAALDRAPRFELLGRVGAGNHGVVYRARDHELRRDVAIKRFTHVLTDDPRAMHRIRREVNALSRVSHPNVVTIHDLVMLPDGDGDESPHLVMELVEGTSVRELLAARGPSRESVRLVRSVLDGLAACHRADILHLDIKPANVLVTTSGDVRIVDFGISRAASDLTATIAGTPQYMSPEQYEGRVDRRSDVYAVGCLLFETLTGRVPFTGSAAVQFMAHRSAPRPDPREFDPTIPPGLVAVLHRAMAIDPAQRYSSAAEFSAALAPFETPGATASAPRAMPTATTVAAAPIQPAAQQPHVARAAGTLALSAMVVAVLPAAVWASTSVPPAVDVRPAAMGDAQATAWWLGAVAIAVLFILLGRREFFGLLGHSRGRALAIAAGAALRGSVVLAFPWYAAAVVGAAESQGLPVPELYGSVWDVAWVLMPLAALALAGRALGRARCGVGGAFVLLMRLAGAGLALAVFVAYSSVS